MLIVFVTLSPQESIIASVFFDKLVHLFIDVYSLDFNCDL